jgi:hypothetical protein
MNVASLHSPLVRRAIETINEGRLDEFLALFGRSSTVVDGETYHGSEAIRAWAERETFGVQMHIDVVQEKNYVWSQNALGSLGGSLERGSNARRKDAHSTDRCLYDRG